MIIHSYEGSTAQAYAERYEYAFESLGEAPTEDLFFRIILIFLKKYAIIKIETHK